MGLPHLISDGYTRDGYLEAVKEVHPALSFRYRPMLADVRQGYLFKMGSANEKKNSRDEQEVLKGAAALVRISVQIVLDQCTDLSLTDCSGAERKLIADGKAMQDAKSILMDVEPNLLIKLSEVCCGLRPSDQLPEPKANGQTNPAVDRLAMRRLSMGDDSAQSHADREAALEEQNQGNLSRA